MEAREQDNIKDFVRQRLGCQCPEDVFADIKVSPQPQGLAGRPVSSVIEIGGRLLVVILALAQEQTVLAGLDRIVAAAMRIRDDRGFHRVRIVVPAQDAEALCSVLEQDVAILTEKDDRVHIHAIDHFQLPVFDLP